MGSIALYKTKRGFEESRKVRLGFQVAAVGVKEIIHTSIGVIATLQFKPKEPWWNRELSQINCCLIFKSDFEV